ncbi:MAG: sugar phosphorylase [Candidatus Scalindua sp. AMX11]|nr:MAG: sugar phosphorylase [Candidatus Scalindua sp.]NOG84302.1 sugar phosphorylase [Planctomycetota bacterium]RZV66429.1 MAG: sugar phosphorylase [Candidatus Scalindua sp. SCAELEC01]TDE63598.1 MAG: sugar phosphorylase [Candidatus Scalindua sp. AMX11]
MRYSAHNQEPDFTRPLLEISSDERKKLIARLSFLYGETDAKSHIPELERILKVYYAHKPREMLELEKQVDPEERFTENDIILITYGDLLRGEGHSPLASLATFLENAPHLRGIVNTLHILPFFPYSSDRGFSITDFRSVDATLGSWMDIEEIGKSFQLMFDGVLNHASSKSYAFQEMLNGNPAYKDIAITFKSQDDLTPEHRKLIIRPRTSDILTEFQSINGPLHVWTTFSPDQIDLNYKNPKVLLWAIDTLLLYVRRGADIIRLDAVTYLWAEPGTSSVHLEQTHEIVKLFRDVLNIVAPGVALITETNVPHQDNVSYFGNGYDEAQMIYNFALPPLVLHTFYRENSDAISQWAKDLEFVSKATTFFNILDTHDGIGLLGVRNILPRKEIDFMVQRAKDHGALISYRTGEDGNDEPYEINTTWFSALNKGMEEDIEFQVKRFVASRSLALTLKGVPGIYFHGLIGTLNNHSIVKSTGSKREINREVIDEKEVRKILLDPQSRLTHIRNQLGNILRIRVQYKAFHPNGDQHVLTLSSDTFTVLRVSPDGKQHIVSITNVTNRSCRIEIPQSGLMVGATRWYDLVSKREWSSVNKNLEILMEPYDIIWLLPFHEREEIQEA